MPKYRVTLTEQERDELQAVVKVGKAAAGKINHARILLLTDESELGPGKKDTAVYSRQLIL